jgi:hypothetical protein
MAAGGMLAPHPSLLVAQRMEHWPHVKSGLRATVTRTAVGRYDSRANHSAGGAWAHPPVHVEAGAPVRQVLAGGFAMAVTVEGRVLRWDSPTFGALWHGASFTELEPDRLLQLQVRRTVVELRRPEGRRRAVGVPELGDGARDIRVEVPTAAAEELRLESRRSQPLTLLAHERGRVASRRPCVVGRRPVRVQTERRELLRLACALDPELRVLLRRGRPHQRRDREASGTAALQPSEAAPHLVVERTLHMTRDDGIPSVQY